MRQSTAGEGSILMHGHVPLSACTVCLEESEIRQQVLVEIMRARLRPA